MPIESTQLVDDVMRHWPMTIRAFLNRRMQCVGCPITCFHTVGDACREHGVDQEAFLEELRAIAAQGSEAPKADRPEAIAGRWPA